jgi:hypothetical protein
MRYIRDRKDFLKNVPMKKGKIKINLGIEPELYYEALALTGVKKICLTKLINNAIRRYVEEYKDEKATEEGYDEDLLGLQIQDVLS